MTAKDQIRQKLDELMGTGWDGVKYPIHYSDPRVCRCFLLGLCPHDALAGTKMSLGNCSKIHNYALKADYENSSKTCRSNQHRFYEVTVLTYLQKVIRSCEIMDRAKKGRLTRCQSNAWNGRIGDKEAELRAYGELVDKKLVEAEELGSKGKVHDALAVIKDVDRLKRRRNRIERCLDRMPNEPVKEQKQNICEECQLCIGLDDNEQRIANHASGRLHNAILAIRRKISELADSLEKAQVPGDWARFDAAQQQAPLPTRLTSRLDLASTRAYSYSPRSSSSRERHRRSRSRSRSRRRSYSSDSYTSYYSSRSRSSSRSRYRRYSESRSRSRSRSRRRSRSRSSSRSCSRSTCSRHGHSHSRSRSYSRSYSRSSSRSSDRSRCSGSCCRSRSRSRSARRASRSRSRSQSSGQRDHRHRRHTEAQSHLSHIPNGSRLSVQDSKSTDEGKAADGSCEPESDVKKANVKDDTKGSHASKGDGRQVVMGVRDRARPSGAAAREAAKNAMAKDKKADSEACSLSPDFPQHALNLDPRRSSSVAAGSHSVQKDTPRIQVTETPQMRDAFGETKAAEVTRASVEQLLGEKNEALSVSEGPKAPFSIRTKPHTSGEHKQTDKIKTQISKAKTLGVRGNGRWSTIKKPVINFGTLKQFNAKQGQRRKMNNDHPGDKLVSANAIMDTPTIEQRTKTHTASEARAGTVEPVEAEAAQPVLCGQKESTVLCGQKESTMATAPEDKKSPKQKSKQDISTANSSSGRHQASAESLAEVRPKTGKKKKRRQPPPTNPAPRKRLESEFSETSSSSLEAHKHKKRQTKRSKESVLKSTKAAASKKTRKPPRRHLKAPSEDESESSTSSSRTPPPRRTRTKEWKRSHRSSVPASGRCKRRGDVSTSKTSKRKRTNTKKRHKASPTKNASTKKRSRREASSSDTSSESDSEDRKPRRKVKLGKKVKRVKRRKRT